MDIPLRNALDDLRRAGASGVPSAYYIEKSRDGSRFAGPIKDRHGKKIGRWFLVKHRTGSYNASTDID